MARRKNARGLFEVAGAKPGDQGDRLSVPNWFDETKEAPPPPPTAPAAPVESEIIDEPLMAIIGDRLRISLRAGGVLVALIGAAGLLFGAFLLGRGTAPAASDASERIRATYNPNVADLQGRPARVVPVPSAPVGGSVDASTTSGVPIQGRSYVIAATGINSASRARDIAEHLRSNGVAATILQGNTGLHMVLSSTAFATPHSPQQRAHGQHVYRLMSNYAASNNLPGLLESLRGGLRTYEHR
ncbi:MAG: hypothetical protein ACYSWU_17920 [Planctomycetota bacterium]